MSSFQIAGSLRELHHSFEFYTTWLCLTLTLQEFYATLLIVNLLQLHCLEEEGAWDVDKPPDKRINRSVIFGSLRETVFEMVMGDISASEFGERFEKIARRSKIKVRPGRQYMRIGLKKEKHVYRRVC